MDIIKRKEAALKGLKFFFTGKPCGRGHVSKRYVSTGSCTQCQHGHLQTLRKNALQGLQAFEVMIPPEDAAALFAYVDALRIARGFMPSSAPASVQGMRRATPDEIQAHRRRVFGHLNAEAGQGDGSGPSAWTGGALL